MAGTITRRQTILLKGDPSKKVLEFIAGEDGIIPGMILQQNTDGEVISNNEAVLRAEVLVAVEDDYRGMNIDGICPDTPGDTGYQEGDTVRCILLERGDVWYAILKDGEVAVVGGYATSNADGKVQVVATTDYRLGKFIEALSPSGADGRIPVEVL